MTHFMPKQIYFISIIVLILWMVGCSDSGNTQAPVADAETQDPVSDPASDDNQDQGGGAEAESEPQKKSSDPFEFGSNQTPPDETTDDENNADNETQPETSTTCFSMPQFAASFSGVYKGGTVTMPGATASVKQFSVAQINTFHGDELVVLWTLAYQADNSSVSMPVFMHGPAEFESPASITVKSDFGTTGLSCSVDMEALRETKQFNMDCTDGSEKVLTLADFSRSSAKLVASTDANCAPFNLDKISGYYEGGTVQIDDGEPDAEAVKIMKLTNNSGLWTLVGGGISVAGFANSNSKIEMNGGHENKGFLFCKLDVGKIQTGKLAMACDTFGENGEKTETRFVNYKKQKM